MATLAGKQSEPISLLRSLIELDYDAIEAYEAAIAKLESSDYRDAMRDFCDDHRRHVAELNPVLQSLGGEPVLKGDIKRVLTKGKVVLASLMGDKAILTAMKSNEDDTNTAYERAVAHDGLSIQVCTLLKRNLSDERRHRAWIVSTLKSLEGRTEARPSSPSFP